MTEVSEQAPSPARASSRIALLIACSATFVAFLDLSVVNIAFPAIARDFTTAAPTTLTWVVSGYAVAFAALLTPAGRLADSLGRRRIFLVALVGFAVTSLLCAVAPSAPWLIGSRVLQGATAALMIPAALALVLAITAPDRITAAIGAWSAAGGLAAVVGPAIGGTLVESFGWRAVFVINIPIAAALVALAAGLRTREPAHQGVGAPAVPDIVGTLAAALGIGAVVAGVTEGQSWGTTSPATLLTVGTGLVLVVVALVRSRRHPSPAIAVDLWRNRRYALTNATSFVFGAAMFAWLLAGPLFLDAIWGYTVLQSAAALSVGAVAAMVTATVAGRIGSANALRLVGVLGALMFAGSAFWASTDAFGATPHLWSVWAPASLLGGGGIGFLVTVLGTVAASSLPPQQFASGVGMNLMSRQVGGALGVGVLASVLAAHPGEALAGFHLLFLACAITAVAAGILAAGLTEKRAVRTDTGTTILAESKE
ncbi:transmembrane secretion effector family protein [Rhodococcus sp. MTM3W5.2]|uniref:MFS transporter n=1 Tax=Rhodococcus sp. MTM3W5.2 TaxID=1805827 RepID=UPI0009791428|nr:MFS transporter [Rhodococcus sp. MTM3W5.2]AQA25015.1 transmembrane secretion effector family protein [Rhodococcus sp. MTM3W5.2]